MARGVKFFFVCFIDTVFLMNNLLLKFFRFSSFSLLKLRRLPEDLHFCTGVADSFLYQQINVHI